GRRWLHTGDLGHMDEDGFLYIDGRLKRIIIDHHGFKIFAPEVESVLSQYEKIEKCCVVGSLDEEFHTGQITVAFVIPKEGCMPDAEEMRKFCEEKLADFRVPSKFVIVDEFPYTSAAKVDYRKLEERAAGV
ncbi:MAG: long-chain fatty acid--CoA ligase, partial [Lachnospiraceae bacterium]|nr:long-chain fatty acid--CoA ligase [Lachnospiraceae bacterium]